MGATSDEARRKDPIRILFCCDPSYFAPLSAAIASLLASNGGEQLEIHLATSLADPAQETRLARWLEGRGANLRLHRFDWGATRWHTSFHITQEAYIRLFAPRFLDSTIDKVLYLDADLLVLGALRRLWEIELTGFAVAAVPDPYGQTRRGALGIGLNVPYVNSGVLLMNLDLWRQHNLTGRLCAYVEEAGETLLFHDQDALNAVLAGQILPLDYRWNLQARMLRRRARRRLPEAAAVARAARAPAILHYTSARKPWLFVMPTPAKALYWRYLRQTPWVAARPRDLRWVKAPEFAINHLLDLAGFDYTWDRVRRATLPGRGLDHLLSFIARLTGRAGATARSSNDRTREGDACEPSRRRGGADAAGFGVTIVTAPEGPLERPDAGPPDPTRTLLMTPRDRALRILYHHRVAASDGMRVHINEVVQALRAEGHEVWVVGPDGDGGARKAGQGSRFERLAELARAALPGELYELLELAYNLPGYIRVRQAVRGFEPDVIYERYNLFLLAGLLAARRADLPILLEINSPLVKERCAAGRLNLKGLGRLCEAALWRGADVALPVTEALAEEVRLTRGAKPTKVAPNGADPARRPAPEVALQVRARLRLDPQDLVLGFVGFVRPWHDVAMAVEALPHLPRTAHLVVVGDGPGCKGLVRRAEAAGVSGRLHLVGRVPHEEVSAYVSAFDVALQTAATPYASPLKLFEYMAFSLPIVAPDQANIREVLADGADALLFPPGDAARLVEALNRLAADPELRRRLGAAALKRLQETPFTWTGAAQRIAAMARQAKAARGCAATSATSTTESPEPA